MLKAPLRITWDITKKCNLFCLHCYNRSGSSDNELNLQEIKKILKNIIESDIFIVTLSGGEPLLKKELWFILEILNDNGIKTNLITNGTLLDEKISEKLSKYVSDVQISIDGLKKTHDHQRGVEGTFDRAIQGCKYLIDNGVHVSLNTVITKNNMKEISDIIELSLNLNVDAYRVTRFIPMGRGMEHRDLLLSPKEFKTVFEYLLKKRKELKGKLNIIPDESLGFYGVSVDGLKWEGCLAAKTEMGVDHMGRAFPCVFLNHEEFVGGNLITDTVDKIWHSMNFDKIRKLENQECKDCKFFGYCKGGCIASSYNIYNSFRKDPYCWR